VHTDQDIKKVFESGLRSLARREHSTLELARKLRTKGFSQEHISQVLQELTMQGYLSDQRFTENYIRYRLNSGWGPVIIVQELLDKGVLQALIDEQMVLLAEDWVLRADQVRQKKFGSGLPKTFAEEVKQKRFLQYKGFTLDQIDRIFKSKF